ncbi:MAG: 3-phosphoshikimate 1-carboxyvinyltransferase [Actinomycetaceae bacterium]|nr:3-phosphoshikimate 1-carboxyvinyltransferase [Actinomycetaceae bacterium]
MTSNPWQAPLAGTPVNADITIPGSKSLTNRELVLSAIAEGRSTISGALSARDTILMINALETLGARIDTGADNWAVEPITPVTGSTPVTIECGLAGTVMRFIPAIAARCTRPVRFTADEQANSRPMAPLFQALRSVGVDVTYETDKPFPVVVQGPARVDGPIQVDSSASSQFLSALLLIAPLLEGEGQYTDIQLTGKAPSLPHIEMTMEALRARGVEVDWISESAVRVRRQAIGARDVVIEPDLSNAGPFLAAAIVTGGQVRIPYWPLKTTQAGNEWLRILREMGAELNLVPQGTVYATLCARADSLHGFNGDMSQYGELVPTLAAICAFADTPSRIENIGHLRGHETDRLTAIATELTKLGIDVEEGEDYLAIDPTNGWQGKLSGPITLHSYADHRMATLGAIIGLKAPGIHVDNIETVSKTMPEFVKLWSKMLDGAHA